MLNLRNKAGVRFAEFIRHFSSLNKLRIYPTILLAPLNARYPAVISIGSPISVAYSSLLANRNLVCGSVYGAGSPDKSENFSGGVKDGGAFIEL